MPEYEIEICRIQSPNELCGHSCGVDSIDKMVQNSYYSHLLRQHDVYKIVIQDQSVGFISLSVCSVDPAKGDAQISEYYVENMMFGAIYVKYLAVDSDLQGLGIGSAALAWVIKYAKEFYRALPIRIIVFDALRDKVRFYSDRGFTIFSHDEFESDSDTVKMYFDLMPQEEYTRVEQYCSELC